MPPAPPTKTRIREHWGTTPTGNRQTWAQTVAAQHVDTMPLVVTAKQEAEQASDDLRNLTRQQEQERTYARVRVYGPTSQFHTPRTTAAQHAAAGVKPTYATTPAVPVVPTSAGPGWACEARGRGRPGWIR
jgi:hypothetical protein